TRPRIHSREKGGSTKFPQRSANPTGRAPAQAPGSQLPLDRLTNRWRVTHRTLIGGRLSGVDLLRVYSTWRYGSPGEIRTPVDGSLPGFWSPKPIIGRVSVFDPC